MTPQDFQDWIERLRGQIIAIVKPLFPPAWHVHVKIRLSREDALACITFKVKEYPSDGAAVGDELHETIEELGKKILASVRPLFAKDSRVEITIKLQGERPPYARITNE